MARPQSRMETEKARDCGLDAALAASFPASDPVAALEPAPERPVGRRGSNPPRKPGRKEPT